MKTQEKIAALLGDVALPLIGFLFWKWSFYFIALYFIFDQLARFLFLPTRIKKAEIEAYLKWSMLLKMGFLLCIESGLIILINTQIIADFNPIVGLQDFFFYKDMGIEQGYILLPLLFLSEWMRHKNDVVLKKSPEILRLDIHKTMQQNQFRLIFFSLMLFIVSFIKLNEWIVVVWFLSMIAFLNLIPNKKSQEKA